VTDIMSALGNSDLIALWEAGSPRHGLDRSLLLGALARPDLPTARLADLPLGVLNEALIRLRSVLFGSHIEAWVKCQHCGERLELVLNTDALLSEAIESDARPDLEIAGFRFRAPCIRDLAAIAAERNPDSAAQRLLGLCCVARPADPVVELEPLLDEVEAGLETLDPTAEFRLDLACEVCGHGWSAPFDIGALLWEEVAARARALLGEVHLLARAYGWSEAEVLALTDLRRAAYLDRVSA